MGDLLRVTIFRFLIVIIIIIIIIIIISNIYPGCSTHSKVVFREVLHPIELEFGNAISNIRYLCNIVAVTVIRCSSFLPTDFFLTTQSAVFELECSLFQAKNCSCKSFKSACCFYE